MIYLHSYFPSAIYGWNELDLEFVIIKTSIKRLLTFIKGATKL